MKLLLDTYIFLWYISADPQLPAAFWEAIRDPANEVYLNVASVWEAVIKYALGKLLWRRLRRYTSRDSARSIASPPCLSRRRRFRTSPACPRCTATRSTAS
jgi:PIN domain nuclease of toxin-antitoxin system